MLQDVRFPELYPRAYIYAVFDRASGENLSRRFAILAADDSTGQIVRYEFKPPESRKIQDRYIVSEIRNIEIVNMEAR
jgi:hypothetical protein